jgi:hypothetical protein
MTETTQPRRSRRSHPALRRAHRVTAGDRGDLASGGVPDGNIQRNAPPGALPSTPLPTRRQISRAPDCGEGECQLPLLSNPPGRPTGPNTGGLGTHPGAGLRRHGEHLDSRTRSHHREGQPTAARPQRIQALQARNPRCRLRSAQLKPSEPCLGRRPCLVQPWGPSKVCRRPLGDRSPWLLLMAVRRTSRDSDYCGETRIAAFQANATPHIRRNARHHSNLKQDVRRGV